MTQYENFNQTQLRNAEGKLNKYLIPILSVIFIVLTFFVGAVIGYRLNYGYKDVRGPSMQSTINAEPYQDSKGYLWQDGVIFEYNATPAVGDIVIIRPDLSSAKTIIKRVIAFGGDKITIKKINDEYRVVVIRASGGGPQPLYEDYIKSYDDWSRSPSRSYNANGATIEYESSFYSTYISGHVSGSQVDGRAGLSLVDDTIYYTIPKNHFFYLGDNRTNSSDARANGTANLDEIVGVVRVIVHDAYYAKKNGTLWWEIFKESCAYFFRNISEYFAWKG